MEYVQGDVILIRFPFTDLSQTKLRPAVILSIGRTDNVLDLVCVQVTSKAHDDDMHFRLSQEMLTVSLPLEVASG
ncbi:MAG: type II toxin-antitoxin system PemK/MazF family toxin [Bacteroidota bacterium]